MDAAPSSAVDNNAPFETDHEGDAITDVDVAMLQEEEDDASEADEDSDAVMDLDVEMKEPKALEHSAEMLFYRKDCFGTTVVNVNHLCQRLNHACKIA